MGCLGCPLLTYLAASGVGKIGIVDFDKVDPSPTESAPLTDADLAAQYRSDADRLSKEAAALRRQAEELVPTKKKTAKKTTASG